jgi:hypothetical protein
MECEGNERPLTILTAKRAVRHNPGAMKKANVFAKAMRLLFDCPTLPTT